MEKVIAAIHNEACDEGLTKAEKVKLFHALTQAMKVLNDSQKEAKDEELEFRICQIEKDQKENHNGK